MTLIWRRILICTLSVLYFDTNLDNIRTTGDVIFPFVKQVNVHSRNKQSSSVTRQKKRKKKSDMMRVMTRVCWLHFISIIVSALCCEICLPTNSICLTLLTHCTSSALSSANQSDDWPNHNLLMSSTWLEAIWSNCISSRLTTWWSKWWQSTLKSTTVCVHGLTLNLCSKAFWEC